LSPVLMSTSAWGRRIFIPSSESSSAIKTFILVSPSQ
jgi:hypothetical protein